MSASIKINEMYKQIDEFKLGPVNLSFEPGTITALVGNNGAGKSTLMKSLMNLVKPTQGDIRILGSPMSEDESWKSDVAYLPQKKIGYDPFTGNQLKELIALLYPNWDEDLFNKMVEELDVKLNKKFKSMSPGMQQKLTLSLTIPRKTPVMILDEPTSHIDMVSKQVLLDLLIDWMDSGERTLIIATHQTEDIKKLADYIAILKDGELLDYNDKDSLSQVFTQYWLSGPLPEEPLPGEKKRKNSRIIITDNEIELELQLSQHQLEWSHKEKLDIEEVITMMLTI